MLLELVDTNLNKGGNAPLMNRAVKGVYIYARDEALRVYLSNYFNN